MSTKVRVLFCCMGNICRSPLAQGVFEHLVGSEGLADHIEVDSAGTHAYHVGEAPDSRAQSTARARGVDLTAQRARQFGAQDFAQFDYVLAMDRGNLEILRRSCPEDQLHKVRLYLDFAPDRPEEEVPDPYYGGQSGFDQVFELVETAAYGLLADIRQRHLSR
jgi:protein-tyrosine phosphatase